MIKHKYHFKDAKGNNEWFVYFTYPLATIGNELGDKKFHDDKDSGYYVTYHGFVSVKEVVGKDNVISYEEV